MHETNVNLRGLEWQRPSVVHPTKNLDDVTEV
jgi:hypothetical protein